MRRVLLLVSSLCFLTIAPATGAPEDMVVTISPKVTRKPGALLLRVKVQPNADNRALVVETDSEDYYRSSEYAVDGEDSERTRHITIENLPEGEYVVTVRLVDSSEKTRATIRERIVVLDAGAELPPQ